MAAAIIKNEGHEFAVSFNTVKEKRQIIDKVNKSSFNGLRFLYTVLVDHVPAKTQLITFNQFIN